MNMDILEILETSANEIRGLRQSVESQKLFIHNITIRLAINQLRHGVLDYHDSDEEWDLLLPLLENGRLLVSSSGEAIFDMRILSREYWESIKKTLASETVAA